MLLTNNYSHAIFNRYSPAKLYHIAAINENAAVTQTVTAKAKILSPTNAILQDNIVTLCDRIDLISKSGLGNSFYFELSADISQYINTLSGMYRLAFEYIYFENNTAISTHDAIYAFEILTSQSHISINSVHNAPVTAELVNDKMAGVMLPGVIHGLDIKPGTAMGMYNLMPGEAVSQSGLKLHVTEENFNVIKCHNLPATGFRIDAVCANDDGSLTNIAGIINEGQPLIDESDKTIIGYFYLSSTMTSIAEARIVKRISASKHIHSRKKRIYNKALTSQTGTNIVMQLSDEADPNTIVLYKNKKRVSPFDYVVLYGANTAVKVLGASLASDTFYVDYDKLQKQMLSNEDILAEVLPAEYIYPWEGSQATFRNAWQYAHRVGNVILGWANVGLILDNGLTVSKFTQLSPDATLTPDNGMHLPMNDVNKVNATITLPNIIKNPHTFILAFSISQIRDGMLLASNSIEAGPKCNFRINLQAFPGDIRFEISHGSIDIHTAATANQKYVIAFRLDANIVSMFVNHNKIIEAAGSVDFINALSEIYLKNELDPVIYYAGYWGKALPDSDIIAIANAIHAHQLI